MKTVSVRQIQQLDKFAIEKLGIHSIALMENAGRSVADEVIRYLKKKKESGISVFCGLGNNAGDGFVCARHLINAGLPVKIFLIGRADKLKQDALTNYLILKNSGYRISEVSQIDAKVLRKIKNSQVIVDAIFGVGLSRAIEEPFRGVIEKLNASRKDIIAVDVPSGLDGTTGRIYGSCIKALKTVTFTYAKQGFFKNDGPRYSGQVIVVDIGIPLKRVKRKAYITSRKRKNGFLISPFFAFTMYALRTTHDEKWLSTIPISML